MKKFVGLILLLTIGTLTPAHAETKLNCYKKTHRRGGLQREWGR